MRGTCRRFSSRVVVGPALADDGAEILAGQGRPRLGQGDEEDVLRALQTPRTRHLLPYRPQQLPDPRQYQDGAELGHLPQAGQGAGSSQEEPDQRTAETTLARARRREVGDHLLGLPSRPAELDVRGELRVVEAEVVRQHPEDVSGVFRPARQAEVDLGHPAMTVGAQEVRQARLKLRGQSHRRGSPAPSRSGGVSRTIRAATGRRVPPGRAPRAPGPSRSWGCAGARATPPAVRRRWRGHPGACRRGRWQPGRWRRPGERRATMRGGKPEHQALDRAQALRGVGISRHVAQRAYLRLPDEPPWPAPPPGAPAPGRRGAERVPGSAPKSTVRKTGHGAPPRARGGDRRRGSGGWGRCAPPRPASLGRGACVRTGCAAPTLCRGRCARPPRQRR